MTPVQVQWFNSGGVEVQWRKSGGRMGEMLKGTGGNVKCLMEDEKS